MYGKVREDMREILRTLCQYKKVEIIEGAVCSIEKYGLSQEADLRADNIVLHHEKLPPVDTSF